MTRKYIHVYMLILSCGQLYVFTYYMRKVTIMTLNTTKLHYVHTVRISEPKLTAMNNITAIKVTATSIGTKAYTICCKSYIVVYPPSKIEGEIG